MLFNPKIRTGLLMSCTLVVAIAAIAWSGSGATHQNNHFNNQDSIPRAKHHSTKKDKNITKDNDWDQSDSDECFTEDIDINIGDVEINIHENINDEIEQALQQAEEQIEALHEQLSPDAIREEVERSLEGLDTENLNEEIERAVQQAVENIDINEIESEIRRSVNEALKEIRSQRFS